MRENCQNLLVRKKVNIAKPSLTLEKTDVAFYDGKIFEGPQLQAGPGHIVAACKAVGQSNQIESTLLVWQSKADLNIFKLAILEKKTVDGSSVAYANGIIIGKDGVVDTRLLVKRI